MADQLQITVRGSREAAQAAFTSFSVFREATVIVTHDGIHVTAHPDASKWAMIAEAWAVSFIRGVATVHIALQNSKRAENAQDS